MNTDLCMANCWLLCLQSGWPSRGFDFGCCVYNQAGLLVRLTFSMCIKCWMYLVDLIAYEVRLCICFQKPFNVNDCWHVFAFYCCRLVVCSSNYYVFAKPVVRCVSSLFSSWSSLLNCVCIVLPLEGDHTAKPTMLFMSRNTSAEISACSGLMNQVIFLLVVCRSKGQPLLGTAIWSLLFMLVQLSVVSCSCWYNSL
jgi:hypothetical protein